MAGIDIRQRKKELRGACKAFRQEMRLSEKAARDERIFQRLIALPEYKQAKQVLTYVSTPIEVATFRLIEHSLRLGKLVAAPRCADGEIAMDFYRITSMRDLEVASFSVLEPRLELCSKITTFDRNSICIVPGLAFDRQGYRLGYGKGYYDRFLNSYSGINIGVCYQGCIKSVLPHGRYDKNVDILITEQFLKRI